MLAKVEPEKVSTKVDSDRAVRGLASEIAAGFMVQALPKKMSTVVDTFSTAANSPRCRDLTAPKWFKPPPVMW
jgi:hypothetical protein